MNRRELLIALHNLGIDSVCADFDGSNGDADITYLYYRIKVSDGVYTTVPNDMLRTRFPNIEAAIINDLARTVRSTLLRLLDDTGKEWCLDDGSFGSINLYVESNTYEIDMHIRITQTDDRYFNDTIVKEGNDVE